MRIKKKNVLNFLEIVIFSNVYDASEAEMTAINYQKKEVTCKIVYWGPGLSGKMTNLRYLAQSFAGLQNNVENVEIEHRNQTRILLLEEMMAGFRVKYEVYGLSGKSHLIDDQRRILADADGVVFVADAQQNRRTENQMKYKELQNELSKLKRNIPVVVQVNKIDLLTDESKQKIQKIFGAQTSSTYILKACAAKGKGVLETFRYICDDILRPITYQISVFTLCNQAGNV